MSDPASSAVRGSAHQTASAARRAFCGVGELGGAEEEYDDDEELPLPPSSGGGATLPIFEITDVEAEWDLVRMSKGSTRRLHRFPFPPKNPNDSRPYQPNYGMTKFKANGEPWTLDGFLGQGWGGEVYTATNRRTNVVSAVKFLERKDDAEVAFLAQLPAALAAHPNIVTYQGLALNVQWGLDFQPCNRGGPVQHLVFMEFVNNGELFDIITHSPFRVLDEAISRRLTLDLIEGLRACREHGISHRDIKPENLLIDSLGRVVVCDLGFAKFAQDKTLMRLTTIGKGTAGYRAPEVMVNQYTSIGRTLSGSYSGEKSDIWTVAQIAFMTQSPMLPFGEDNKQSNYCVGSILDLHPTPEAFWRQYDKLSAKYGGAQAGFAPLSESMRSFLGTLWKLDPNERPTFQNLHDAAAGDTATLVQFPGLAWLAEPLPTAMDMLKALHWRHQCFYVRMDGVREALGDFLRRHKTSQEAFEEIDSNSDQIVDATELAKAMRTAGHPDIHDIQAAELLRGITEEFGRHDSESFASKKKKRKTSLSLLFPDVAGLASCDFERYFQSLKQKEEASSVKYRVTERNVLHFYFVQLESAKAPETSETPLEAIASTLLKAIQSAAVSEDAETCPSGSRRSSGSDTHTLTESLQLVFHTSSSNGSATEKFHSENEDDTTASLCRASSSESIPADVSHSFECELKVFSGGERPRSTRLLLHVSACNPMQPLTSERRVSLPAHALRISAQRIWGSAVEVLTAWRMIMEHWDESSGWAAVVPAEAPDTDAT